MNRLLLEPWELGADGTALVNGSRAAHLLDICKITIGDTVRLGVVGGPIGSGRVLEYVGKRALRFGVELTPGAPVVPRVVVYLALPRPQMLKRILEKAATFGVQRLVLFRSERVEKSYFSTPLLRDESVAQHLRLGLEQGGSTYLPEVTVYRRFGEFLDGEREVIESSASKFLFDPAADVTLLGYRKQLKDSPKHLFVIGPEGGLLPRETATFAERGFLPTKLAQNILRVESAFDFALAQYSMLALD